jgi:phenylalanyl-tRNA synthetase beta chain
MLKSLKAVEIFRDANKLPGHYSVLIRTVFQSQERTLVDEDLTAWSAAIIGALQSLGGAIRS